MTLRSPQTGGSGAACCSSFGAKAELEVADELYAPDYVDHVGRGPEPGQVRGPEGIEQAVTLFRTAFPDLTYTVHEEIAERDLVMTRFSARGTQRGPFLGVAPTGRVVTYTGMDLNRIANGQIVEFLGQLRCAGAASAAWLGAAGERILKRTGVSMRLAPVAILAALLAATPALAEKYAAVSKSAMSITGDIDFVPGTITFQNGAKINLVDVTIGQDGNWQLGGAPVPGDIFKLIPPAYPKLLNGNRLCGSLVTYAVMYFLSPDDLNLNLYTGATAPNGSDSDQLCATFSYEGE